MDLYRTKRTVSALWMLTALIVVLTFPMSTPITIAVALLGGVVPLALLLLWNEPPQTMSERIRQARQ